MTVRGQSFKANLSVNSISNLRNKLNFTLIHINFDVIYINILNLVSKTDSEMPNNTYLINFEILNRELVITPRLDCNADSKESKNLTLLLALLSHSKEW